MKEFGSEPYFMFPFSRDKNKNQKKKNSLMIQLILLQIPKKYRKNERKDMMKKIDLQENHRSMLLNFFLNYQNLFIIIQ